MLLRLPTVSILEILSYSSSTLSGHLNSIQTCRTIKKIGPLVSLRIPIVIGFNGNECTPFDRTCVRAQLGIKQSSYTRHRIVQTFQQEKKERRCEFKQLFFHLRPRNLVVRWPFTRLLSDKDAFPVHLLGPQLVELTLEIGKYDSYVGSLADHPTAIKLEYCFEKCTRLHALTLKNPCSGPYNCAAIYFSQVVYSFYSLPTGSLGSLEKLILSEFTHSDVFFGSEQRGLEKKAGRHLVTYNWPHLTDLTCNNAFLKVEDMTRFHSLTRLTVCFSTLNRSDGEDLVIDCAQLAAPNLIALSLDIRVRLSSSFRAVRLFQNVGSLPSSLRELYIGYGVDDSRHSWDALLLTHFQYLQPLASTLKKLTLNANGCSVTTSLVKAGLNRLVCLDTLVLQNMMFDYPYIVLDSNMQRQMTSFQQEYLNELGTLPSLTELNLSSCTLKTLTTATLSHLCLHL